MKRSLSSVVVVLAVLATACGSQIQHGLEERDANEVLSVLVARGFKAQKVPEKGKKPTWAIEVGETEVADAVMVLNELKLPRAPRPTTKSIVQNQGLIETPGAERLRQMEAEEGDIEEALETMDGVLGASVELVVPPPPRPGMPAIASKASVLLRARPDALERLGQQRGELRAFVAGAVEGLKAEEVVLIMDPVTVAAAPAHDEKPQANLRLLVIALGAALTIVAVLLVVMAARARRPRDERAVPPTPSELERPIAKETTQPRAPQRPIVNAAVQRKVA